MQQRRWSDLTPRQRAGLLALGAVQLSLAGAAWADLARRPRAQVAGSKGVWAAVIAVNWVGPLAYLRWGRRPARRRPRRSSGYLRPGGRALRP